MAIKTSIALPAAALCESMDLRLCPEISEVVLLPISLRSDLRAPRRLTHPVHIFPDHCGELRQATARAQPWTHAEFQVPAVTTMDGQLL